MRTWWSGSEDQAVAPGAAASRNRSRSARLTKCDLPVHLSREGEALRGQCRTPARGSRNFVAEIATLSRPEVASITTRQQELLRVAAGHLEVAGRAGPEDLRVAELSLAVRALDSLCGLGSGAAEAEELVFQRFCIGK